MKNIKQLEGILKSQPYPLLFKIALMICVITICFLAFTVREYDMGEHSYDKANHFFAFFILAFLIDFAYPRMAFAGAKINALFGFAVFIELVQYFLPYRSFSLIDIAADIVGVLFYLVLKRRIAAVRSLA